MVNVTIYIKHTWILWAIVEAVEILLGMSPRIMGNFLGYNIW